MEYSEWKNYPRHNDAKSYLCPGYILKDDARFVMEPSFYTQLQNLKPLFPDRYNEIIEAINQRVIKNKKVFFTLDVDAPFIVLKDYIYLEITDILNPLKIFVEDKSRGSDYGD
ncbi:MAG: hypothetical protein MJ208_00980 [Bacilli bacterium]|nr:hypothetical protein [Bacilli bacterium]